MDKKRSDTFILVSLFLILFFTVLSGLGVFSNVQRSLTDRLYGDITPREDIILVVIDDKSIQEIGRWPWPRDIFADTLLYLKDAKVAAVDVAFFENSTRESDILLESAINKTGNVILPVEYTSFEGDKNGVYGRDILKPVGNMGDYARDTGYINIITDPDGITRAVNSNIHGDYKSFISSIYQAVYNKSIPHENRLLINFIGPPGSFKRYSLTDIYNQRIKKEDISGKIVFIGAAAPDLHDDYFVPSSDGKAMPGVEVHANTLQMIIDDNYLKEEPYYLLLLSIILSIIFTAMIIYLLRLRIAIPMIIIAVILYIFLVVLVFNRGMILDVIYPPLAIVVSTFSYITLLYFEEYTKKRQISDAFGKYVSPELLEEILKNPKKLRLGGANRRITILFSDIRGFTSISEKLSPERLVALLNEYLTDMTGIILDNEGMVDKYIGDAIMALWGALLGKKDHAIFACRSAVIMKERLLDMQKEWSRRGLPPLSIGIGINTGEVIVGNMGSDQRFDYTAMGDSVNLASRLEGVNKVYNTTIIISEQTRLEAGNLFIYRELDKVRVKGKEKPIRIYELIGEKEIDEDISWIKLFEEGLGYYRKKEWDKAIRSFDSILKIRDDPPSKLFIERCRLFKKAPPPRSWDGVFGMKSK